MKKQLIEKINLELLNKGFGVKNMDFFFDILAKKNGKTLLIKVLEDANSIDSITSHNLGSLASFIGASPLIISNKAGNLLEDSIVYSRFGLPVINKETFSSCLDKDFPFLKSTKAGISGSIDNKKMEDLREEFSASQLASKFGVSRKMIIKYEGGADITGKRMLRVYENFGNIFSEINIFETKDELKENYSTEFGEKYSSLGFKVSEFSRTPFNLAAKQSDEIILTKIGDNFNKHLAEIAKILEVDDLVIFKRRKPKDIPALKREEFLEIEKAGELIKVIKEF